MKREQLYESVSIRTEKLDAYPIRENQQHFFELIYVLSGKGKYHLNQNIFRYRRAQLFFIRPNDTHFFEIEAKSEFFFLRFNNIYIESDALHTENIEHLEFILQNAIRHPGTILSDKTDKDLVKATIRAIVKEYEDKELYNTELLQQLVNILIMIVARNIAKDLSEKVNENTDARIIEILNYIQSNIYKPKTLRTKAISEHFNISVNYLGKYFKKHCKETLQEYIAQCKISQIEKVLKHSDKRINEIVTEFNFTDESHLNKFFKQKRGITPTQFRYSTE